MRNLLKIVKPLITVKILALRKLTVYCIKNYAPTLSSFPVFHIVEVRVTNLFCPSGEQIDIK